MNDIEIVWEDDGSHGFLSEIGEIVPGLRKSSKYLKLDVVFVFKKTTLNSIVDYLLTHGELKINNRLARELIGLTKCIILYALSPKSADIIFLDNDEFRDMAKLFKKELGEYFITEHSLKNFPKSKLLMERMISKKLIEKDGDRYYVVGHIVNNIKIDTSKVIKYN